MLPPESDLLDPAACAEAAGLLYVTDEEPGITRRRRGSGFSYHHPDGTLVTGPERERIQALVIPPAWEEVWISPEAEGHLQVTGRDAAGRKQYRYHPRFRELRDALKFERMVPFGESLPALRLQVEADLRRRTLDRRKVVALAVRLLEETLIRVGNPAYAEDGSFGLTTLRDRHVDFEGGTVRFTFTGKSGKEHEVNLHDHHLARLVRLCRDVPGYTLFQYYADGGKGAIESGDVNDYLREVTGQPFSAKDFRTWGGTVLAAKALRARGAAESQKEAEKNIVGACREVAAALGNTLATCRSYYIHPAIPEAYRQGRLITHLQRRNRGNTPDGLEPVEAAVVGLLKETF
jgi:DNA topoisomerase I